ncbi:MULTISPECIES: hypothetical protein [Marivita]|uniref:Uncharacterized protein n=1 Tax=Marivita cryptomonadis TaxID=505252 RepID=A0A9Q2PDT5_9RHOB|nr:MULTISPECIES: hypothetical protein [Marivita]MBM2323573.1 hypothetical protein [Marivita cryptomonadis]MBM2333160.1 hypothetical protein [Marivita cryptomonadis]MBM2342739.1 hypothetical protein [Marivita cryptomonadis]MBM2347408.1 hypothetical protein [Marivita cryptomonadis]MBM2352091.1 hypothetical protein [Marivita cryptomonadis]
MNYGLATPSDLLEKLKRDAIKLEQPPDPDMVFNFLLTAQALSEWTRQYYEEESQKAGFYRDKKKALYLPSEAVNWYSETSCFPNELATCDYLRHISNCLQIAELTANASKHFHWNDTKRIKQISKDPQISDCYQYFFTDCHEDTYFEIEEIIYSLSQVKQILVQFFSGLVAHLDRVKNDS